MGPHVLHQRIRDRLIEYIEWVWGYEDEIEPRLGMDELLNQWEDVITRPICESNLPAPVFTTDELQALKNLDNGWAQLCSATPQHIASDAVVFETSERATFVALAVEAAKIFQRRGRLLEDLPAQSRA